MSKKFEQLLDLVVNEEMDKANELFHELVVEMSREIYENMITQEGDDEEDDMEESMYSDEGMEEETTMEIGGDKSDDFVSDVEDDMGDEMDSDDMGDEMDSDEMDSDDMGDMDDMGDEMDDEGADERISDLEDALEELKAEFEALMAGEKAEPEHADMFGDEEDESGEEKKEAFHMEGRRMTREYHEKVGDGHGADKKGKGEEGGINTKSTVSSAKGRPSSTASANNIAQAGTGTDAKPGVGGLLKKGGEFVKSGTQNVGNTKAKGYSDKVTGGGAEKKHAGETNVNSKPVVGG